MRTPRERSHFCSAPATVGEHDVVDRAPERVLDALEVGQLLAHPDEPPVRPDLDVERRLGRRVHPGPHDLAEPLERLARLLQRLAGRLAAATTRAAVPNGSDTSPRTPRAAMSRRLGVGCGVQARSGCSTGAGTGVRSNSTVARSTPDTPSTSAWCVLVMSAKRPPSRPVHEPHLPQRLGAVERLRVHARGERAQLRLGAGRRQRGVAHVVLEVEAGVVDPQRAAGLDGREGELLAEARHEVQARAHVVGEPLVGGRRALEDHHRADVHVGRRALLRDEGRIHRGQPVAVLLGHATEPMRHRSTVSRPVATAVTSTTVSTRSYERPAARRRNAGRPARWPSAAGGTSAATQAASGTAPPAPASASAVVVDRGEADERRRERVAHRGGRQPAREQQQDDGRAAGGRRRVERARHQPRGRPGPARRLVRRARPRRAARGAPVHHEGEHDAGGDEQLQRDVVERAQHGDPGQRTRSDHGTTAATSRHTGAGRRPSERSVSRLISRPTRVISPTACSGEGAAA